MTCIYKMAERVGFEPTVEFPLHTLSKRAPSTARTSLRKLGPGRDTDERSGPQFIMQLSQLVRAVVPATVRA